MMPNPLDFSKIEALRKHMLISTRDMAELFGVSRVTYYGWVRGQTVRSKNTDKVLSTTRTLLAIMREHGWPSREVLGLTAPMRKHRLLALVSQYQ